MPGYSGDRFPELSAEDREEYTCSICQDIFNTPVTTTCCRQTFCEDCINEWLQTNTTCPYDRKPLTRSGLFKSPRLVLNTLSRFRIHCDYSAHGCQEIVKLDDLSKHTVNCLYKDAKCPKCQCDRTSGHDCIVALLSENNMLKKKLADDLVINSAFKNEALIEIEAVKNEANREMEALKQELKRANVALTIEQLKSSIEKIYADKPETHDTKLLVECRHNLSAPELLTNTMDTDMTAKTLSIISAQMTKQKNLFNVCKQIVNDMDKEFGTSWHCLADRGKAGFAYYTPDRCNFMRVRIAPITLILFSTVTLNLENLKYRLDNKKIDNDDISIKYQTIKPFMIEMVKDMTFETIKSADTLSEIAKNIMDEMKIKFHHK